MVLTAIGSARAMGAKGEHASASDVRGWKTSKREVKSERNSKWEGVSVHGLVFELLNILFMIMCKRLSEYSPNAVSFF